MIDRVGRRVPEPTFPRFEAREIRSRQDRVRRYMEEDGIDLLLLTERENVIYFTGLSSIAWVQKGVPPAVVLLARDEPETIMILPDFWLGTAEKTTWLNDYVLHRNSHSNPDDFARLVVEVVKSRGWENGRIGYEAGQEMIIGIPIRQFDAIRHGLGDATWVDAGNAVWRTRMIKSPDEVDLLRRSAVVTGRAQELVRSRAAAGMNELEIGTMLRIAMLEQGGSEQNQIFLNMRAGRARYNMTDTHPKNNKLLRGDMLIVDAGLYLEGYASDTARCMSVGEPSEFQIGVYKSVLEAKRSALARVRAGTPASEVYFAVRDVYDKLGFPVHIDMVGHGIGMDVHEPPMLSPNNHKLLEENMVLCIEPWLTLPNEEGVFTIEDTFVVTGDGWEQLTLNNANELWSTAA